MCNRLLECVFGIDSCNVVDRQKIPDAYKSFFDLLVAIVAQSADRHQSVRRRTRPGAAIHRMSSTAAHAAGAGANAAREGSKGLVPLKPKEDAPQGRFQRKVVSNDAVLEEVVELLTDIARAVRLGSSGSRIPVPPPAAAADKSALVWRR